MNDDELCSALRSFGIGPVDPKTWNRMKLVQMLDIARSGASSVGNRNLPTYGAMNDVVLQQQPPEKLQRRSKPKHKRATSPVPSHIERSTEQSYSFIRHPRKNSFYSRLAAVLFVAIAVGSLPHVQTMLSDAANFIQSILPKFPFSSQSSPAIAESERGPPPFLCVLETKMEVRSCFNGKKNLTKSNETWTLCAAGHGWQEKTKSCYKCPLNTQMVVNQKTGRSMCETCAEGSHNPNPDYFPKCSCKIHLEPVANGTCLPCQIGYFKDEDSPHNAACRKCPDPAKNYSQVGSTSNQDCKPWPKKWELAGMAATFKQLRETLRKNVQALVETLSNWWASVTNYFKEIVNETWENIHKMFEEWDKSGIKPEALDWNTNKKKKCKFFWFSCVDVPVFRQPDDPNKCPYNTWQDLLEHLKGQPQWKEWRSAPVQQRPKLSKPIVVMFHPDKPFAMANCQRENQNSKPRSWATEITSVIGGLMDQDRIEVRSKK